MEQQTKIEVSKPILSPTRSLDEGFESDPDRISTDSELTSSTQTPTFDLLHRTDRDGVQHTTITRHNIESLPISSIICLDGESESDNNVDDGKLQNTDKVEQQPLQQQQSALKVDQKQQQQQQHVYRRVKNKAPLPPNLKSNSTNSIYQTIQPRSQSVDRIPRSSSSSTSSSIVSNQNILAGRFVRVTVDPKQQYLNYFKNYKSYQNYQSNSSGGSTRLLPTVGSVSNLYKSYHINSNSNSNSNKNISISSTATHEPSGLLSLSNLSSMMPMQYGYSTVKAPKTNYHHFSHHQQPQSIQQSHFLASSWTASMDPRKARK
jgi:hypothetical protein